MPSKPLAGVAVLIAALAFAAPAEAHTFGAVGAGLSEGFFHPLGGLDHVLAMVAVGLWAAQQGGRALWRIPATFVAALVLGGGLAAAGVVLPGVELGVAASVAVLGLVIALAARPSPVAGMALVGAFAVLHGQAHGMELPAAAAPALYALGFTLSTALLHGLGLAIVLVPRALGRLASPLPLRLCGVAVVVLAPVSVAIAAA
jgi:urease accessory protein